MFLDKLLALAGNLLLGALEKVLSAFSATAREKRVEKTLKDLGFSEGEIRRHEVNADVQKRAREIESRPSGGVHSNIDRL